LKPKKISQKHSSSSTIQNSGQVGTQHQNTDTLKTYACPILIKQKIEKKEDSVKVGTDYEQQRAKDYLTQEHRNSNNSSIRTKMITSKLS
jgi:hypothetical protein